MKVTLQALADALGAELKGDPGLDITRINTLDKAGPGEVAFLSDSKYRHLLAETKDRKSTRLNSSH